MRFYNILLLTSTLTYSQINPKNIDIVRDQYGIPHIFAKTDAELAYGLAWANAEDDFNTIQEAYLAGNAMLSKHIGLKGAPADFITQFIGSKELIDEKIGEISNDYLKVISAYAEGLNSYAKKNPEKVLHKKLFPITPKMMMMYSQLQLFISNQGADWAGRILNNDTQDEYLDQNLSINETSLYSLLYNSNESLSSVIRGQNSLGSIFERYGYEALPSDMSPSPEGMRYFSGGFNTYLYGADNNYNFNAIQLEFPYPGLRDTSSSRIAFSLAFVDIVQEYFLNYFNLDLFSL